jgi:putative hydrolase of the HAD superfamily
MRPKAILFDLDDTLISPNLHRTIFWRDSLTEVWRETFGAAAALPEDIETLVDAIDRSARHFWSEPARHKTGRLNLDKARFRILDAGIGPDDRFNDEIRWAVADRCGRLMTERTTLFPDAIETLEALKAEGIRLALVTNGASEPQRAKVAKFALEQHFLHVQIEGEAGVGKPEPEAYHKALAALDAHPEETWMVGDNLEWEVAAPQRLGIFAVWRDPRGAGQLPPGTAVTPDKVVTRLVELLG